MRSAAPRDRVLPPVVLWSPGSIYPTGSPRPTAARRPGSGGEVIQPAPPGRDELLVIFVGIDTDPTLLDHTHLDGLPQGQDAQLFQLFQLLQRVRRAAGQLQQEVAAVGVQA